MYWRKSVSVGASSFFPTNSWNSFRAFMQILMARSFEGYLQQGPSYIHWLWLRVDLVLANRGWKRRRDEHGRNLLLMPRLILHWSYCCTRLSYWIQAKNMNSKVVPWDWVRRHSIYLSNESLELDKILRTDFTNGRLKNLNKCNLMNRIIFIHKIPFSR